MSQPRRVLIVDDAATIRQYHRNVLEEGGYTVDEAVNGYEALERSSASSYDLFVVDVNMPLMDGFTLVENLRRDGASAAVPIVMISTENRDGHAGRAQTAGANLYLVKPVSPRELLTVADLLTAAGGVRS